MWGKRGQRVQKVSWAKSKQHQGVRGSWGKRSLNMAKKIKERGLRRSFGKRKFHHVGGTIWPRWKKAERMPEGKANHLWAVHGKRGLNSKHIVKLVNKGSKQRLRGMWGKRGNNFWKMVTFPNAIPFSSSHHLQKMILHLMISNFMSLVIESENPEWKAASTRYYLFSSFPWGTEYAPNGAIKCMYQQSGQCDLFWVKVFWT